MNSNNSSKNEATRKSTLRAISKEPPVAVCKKCLQALKAREFAKNRKGVRLKNVPENDGR